ncbi:hypothetical protein GCM10009557_18040 [Virgisporangium ochraceum]|uniref:Tetratricopeptide repeat protein n=1 Tax=Virgisporangium ochraceum TaxID=65505 RepID=A0A8J4A3D3_9ACTN|nr:tetratricopeptide repeat protein [Virgisporangium ochraceum]GIJ73478.1 hypothetical protein Voc01_083950 [Virgisporangium ochraceum]
MHVTPSSVQEMMLRNERAAGLLRRGMLDEAATEFAAIGDWCERAFGDRDERTLTSRNNLAATLFKQGRLEEAEAMYRRIVDAQGEHADGTAHNNLGTVLYHLGRVREAEPVLRTALRMHHHASGDDDPEATRAMENLARVLARLGHRAEARGLAEDYLRTHTRSHRVRPEQVEKVRRLLSEL